MPADVDTGSEERVPASTTAPETTPPAPTSLEVTDSNGYRFALRVEDITLDPTTQRPGFTLAMIDIEVTNLLPDRQNVAFDVHVGRRARVAILESQYQSAGGCPMRAGVISYTGYCLHLADRDQDVDTPTVVLGPGSSTVLTVRMSAPDNLGITPADIAVFFFDPGFTTEPDTDPYGGDDEIQNMAASPDLFIKVP